MIVSAEAIRTGILPMTYMPREHVVFHQENQPVFRKNIHREPPGFFGNDGSTEGKKHRYLYTRQIVMQASASIVGDSDPQEFFDRGNGFDGTLRIENSLLPDNQKNMRLAQPIVIDTYITESGAAQFRTRVDLPISPATRVYSYTDTEQVALNGISQEAWSDALHYPHEKEQDEFDPSQALSINDIEKWYDPASSRKVRVTITSPAISESFKRLAEFCLLLRSDLQVKPHEEVA